MLLKSGLCGQSCNRRRSSTASGMQQVHHACLQQQQQPLPSAALSRGTLQRRRQVTAYSAAAAVAESQQLEQLQQQQQVELSFSRLANTVISYSSNGDGHSSTPSSSSSSSSAQRLIPVPVPKASSYTAQQTPTTPVNLLVIEVFAGSYSAGRLAARRNSSSTGIRVSAYAAVELDPAFMKRAPDSTVLGIPEHNSRTSIINGSITDPAVHGKLLRFVQQMLQQSSDGTGPVVDGVMLMGGPPCTMYSNCQTYQLPLVIEPDPDSFRRKLFASDRVVTGFLKLYNIIKTVCADIRWHHPSTKQPVPSCILMENPFSPSYMPIKYTPQEVAASNGQLKPRQIKMIEKQNLSGRHFLQPYLAHTGGPLYVSLHCWCSYAHLTHPKKPTYVFSDLKGLQDTPCICRVCRPEGRNLRSVGMGGGGRLIEVPVYQQHYMRVHDMETGDGGERATWPDAWLDRMAWLFSNSILLQRRPRCSRSSSSHGSGSSGPGLTAHGRQCSTTAAAATVGSNTLVSSSSSRDEAAAAAVVDAALPSSRGSSASRARRQSHGSNSGSSSRARSGSQSSGDQGSAATTGHGGQSSSADRSYQSSPGLLLNSNSSQSSTNSNSCQSDKPSGDSISHAPSSRCQGRSKRNSSSSHSSSPSSGPSSHVSGASSSRHSSSSHSSEASSSASTAEGGGTSRRRSRHRRTSKASSKLVAAATAAAAAANSIKV